MIYENGKQVKVDIPYLLDNKAYDIDLSIVVPAFNEENRLPTMMKDTLTVISFPCLSSDKSIIFFFSILREN